MAKQGKFLVFEKPKSPLQSVSSTIPNLEDGEILVKINYATLCGSDLHTFCGFMLLAQSLYLFKTANIY